MRYQIQIDQSKRGCRFSIMLGDKLVGVFSDEYYTLDQIQLYVSGLNSM